MRTLDRLLPNPNLLLLLLPSHNSPMGNHRFRVSEMMPSSWFFKLKDATRYAAMKRTHHHHHHHHHHPLSAPQPLPLPRRSSCYISTRERTDGFPHSPVNHKASDTQFPSSSPRKLLPPTPPPPPPPPPPPAKPVPDDLSHPNLPPILTKPLAKKAAAAGEIGDEIGSRRSPPRFAAGGGKQRSRALEESLVVVKSSVDPPRDFRESMVEMIVENEIRSARELEELLMCYLSLNSRRYHGVILREFKQIWFEFIAH